jgi:hypothetical protein
MDPQQQGHRWTSFLADLWRHTPLGIVLDAVRQPSIAQRERKRTARRLRAVPSRTRIAAQLK